MTGETFETTSLGSSGPGQVHLTGYDNALSTPPHSYSCLEKLQEQLMNYCTGVPACSQNYWTKMGICEAFAGK